MYRLKVSLPFVIIIGLLVIASAFTGQAQRQPRFAQPENLFGCTTSADLDCGAQLDVGKHVFYVPEDEEGCDTSAPQGCKFPAVINNIPTVFNTSTGRFEFIRDARGRIVVDLSIHRPARKGGDFNKDNVPFSSGSDKGQARPMSNLDSRGVF